MRIMPRAFSVTPIYNLVCVTPIFTEIVAWYNFVIEWIIERKSTQVLVKVSKSSILLHPQGKLGNWFTNMLWNHNFAWQYSVMFKFFWYVPSSHHHSLCIALMHFSLLPLGSKKENSNRSGDNRLPIYLNWNL